GRTVAPMNVREKFRQRTVPAEGEDHSRRTENIAGDKAEGGDRRAGDQNRATNVTKKFRSRFRERCIRMVREVAAERSLRDNLDQNINDGRDDEREIRGTRNR